MYFFKIIIVIFIFISHKSYTDVILLNDSTNNINNEQTNKNQENTNNNQKQINNKQKTLITFDPNTLCNAKKEVIKKVNAITYFTFGTEGKPVIDIYISPSCLHCAQFLTEDLKTFLDKYKNDCFIKVMLIPVLAKDFFVMKLIQSAAIDSSAYYLIFSNYMTRARATIDNTHPNEEQKALYKGSNTDTDMIKYQVIAKDFGFTDDKIVNAIPDMDEDYERAVMEYYINTIKTIVNTLQIDHNKQQELEVPLIICNKKSYKTLEKAFESLKQQLT